MKKLNFIALIEELNHQGMCDASAAIALFHSDYLIVANDEDNILRVYQAKKSGKPSQESASINGRETQQKIQK
ncbi:MAG: hypothetical protein HC939_03245 [Pleurocapsa sp. SU_5_0]|nr:hypothetical protein [Pleurocapsa sp. SU_5_0]